MTGGSIAGKIAESIARARARPLEPREALLSLLEYAESARLDRVVLSVLRRVAGGEDPSKLVREQARLMCTGGVESRAVLECLGPEKALQMASGRGVLSGVAVLLKDNVDHIRFKTTLGTSYYTVKPSKTAPLAAALEAAGAVSAGKANMHELALGTTNVNPHTGTPVNPVCPGRIPGGSSGGSASAVASGYAPASLANDAGGSIRLPAAYTGVYGFKPSSGYLPGEGLSPRVTMLAAPGFITRSSPDTVALVAALKPWVPAAVLGILEHYGGRRPRILVPRDMLESADGTVEGAFRESLEALSQAGWRVEWGELGLPEWLDRARVVVTLVDALEDLLEVYRSHRDKMGADVAMLLDIARDTPGWAYVRARRLIMEARRLLIGKLKVYDAIVTPTAPIEPPRVEEADYKLSASTRLIEYTAPWNSLDLPAASVPGSSRLPCGVPVGVQLASPHGEEHLLALSILAEAALRG